MFRNNTEIQILCIVVYIINGLQNELNRVDRFEEKRCQMWREVFQKNIMTSSHVTSIKVKICTS